MADWLEWRTGWNGPALPAHGYRMWASPSVFMANQLVISATLVAPAAPRHSRENGNPEAFATGRPASDGQPWIPAPRWGLGTSFGGTMQGAVDSRFRGNDRWVGMTVGGTDGGREGRGREGRTGGNGPALPAHGYRMWASPSVFMANQLVISATLVAPAAPRHSRENGNPEAFATGRPALDGQPWIPAPRWGLGTSSGGTMQGAVDSRFRGNDRWVGMTVGGTDGWAGMADWRERRKVGMAGGRERPGGAPPMAIACGRVLPYSWRINSSFLPHS